MMIFVLILAYYVWSLVYWYKKFIQIPLNILRSTEDVGEAISKIRQSSYTNDHVTSLGERGGDSTREEIGWDLLLGETGPWFLYCFAASPFVFVYYCFTSKVVTNSLFGYRPTVGSDVDRIDISAEDYELFKQFKEQK